MIRALVDFALNNRFVVIAIAVLLTAWGVVSFHNLPVEAYPDIADNYVTVITQWPGRSAEEVEQQVTIPVEIQMNGIPHLSFLRSESIFGLSFVIMIFDDSSDQRLEPAESAGAAHAGEPAAGSAAADGHGLEHGWPDLLVHAAKHQSEIRPDGAAVHRRLDSAQGIQVRAECRGCLRLRRHGARIPGARRPEQAGVLRIEHRPGGAATRQ